MVGLIGLITASCSDDESSNGTSATTGAPVTTAAPDTTAPSTTTAAPSTTEGLPPALPNGQPLEAGVTYRVPASTLGRSMQFTNAVDGALAVAGEGGMALTADQTGFQVLLVVADYSKVRFFTDPLVDAYSLQGVEALTAATNEAPADFFAYFASLPGVVTGPITDAEIAGRPAKAMTWSFGVFEGGFPCGPAQACVNAAWLGNWVSSYFEGNSGTTYLLEIDGQQVLVEVQNLPGAQDVADSLVIGD